MRLADWASLSSPAVLATRCGLEYIDMDAIIPKLSLGIVLYEFQAVRTDTINQVYLTRL